MKLVSLASTDIDKDNLGDFFNENGWCFDDGGDCLNVDWNALNTAFPDIYENYGYWWTRDSKGDSCEAFPVGSADNAVGMDGRHSNDGLYALCE